MPTTSSLYLGPMRTVFAHFCHIFKQTTLQTPQKSLFKPLKPPINPPKSLNPPFHSLTIATTAVAPSGARPETRCTAQTSASSRTRASRRALGVEKHGLEGFAGSKTCFGFNF
jgi:hypothetical protein